MHKLKLAVESLRVDSFTTSEERNGPGGTVLGFDSTNYSYWCTAATSEGPNVCKETDALGCPQPDPKLNPE